MQLDEFARERQTKPGTFRFLAARAYLAKFLEYIDAVFGRNPDACITDAYFYSAG